MVRYILYKIVIINMVCDCYDCVCKTETQCINGRCKCKCCTSNKIDPKYNII